MMIMVLVADAMGLWSYFARSPHNATIITGLITTTIVVTMQFTRARRDG
jgi:hypothetical protein